MLGPLEVLRDGRRVEPSGGKLRTLLIDLLMHRTQYRTGPQLIDDLWGGQPPATATGILRNYLSQLRELVGADLLVRRGPGYGIDSPADHLDSERFEQLAEQARSADRSGDLAAVVDLTTAALALWRGEALVDVADADFAQPHLARLNELREATTELYLEALIGVGRAKEAIALLEESLVVDPLRERLWWLLMLAQYRCGRQADALRSYQRVRTELTDQLGVEPGVELRRLEVAILNQSPGLDDLVRRTAAPPVVQGQSVAGVVVARAPRRYRTALLGREVELDALVGRVEAGAVLTLTGVGGAGKTRLAVEVAGRLEDRWLDGVAFLDLAPVIDENMVAAAALMALGLDEEPIRPPIDTVTRALQNRQMLLVVDNCEHVLAAAGQLADAVLDAAPSCAVLATSRLPLGIVGEWVWPVGPLATDGEQSGAVQLLAERAAAVNPDFRSDRQAVELARRLGGLPLAIEMVAPWTRTLSTADIADRLDQLMAIGDRSRPERQQRMEAVFDWGDRRLDPDTRRVYHRLGVFVGDFDLAAAETVVPAEAGEQPGVLPALGRLVDHSLVTAETLSGPTRYRLLEPVRQFAAARLLSDGEDVEVRGRHLLHYRSVALRIGKHAAGPEATSWLARADKEIANLRAAHDHALRIRRADDATILAGGLYWYWWIRASSSEGIDRLSRSLALDPAPGPRSRARIGLASLLIQADRLEEAREQAEAALSDARIAGDPRLEAHALGTVGRAASDRLDYGLAATMLQEAQTRFEALENRGGTAWCLFVRYAAAPSPDAQAAALPGLYRAHRLYAEEGAPWGQAWTSCLLGLAAIREGRIDAAVELTAANRLIDENGLRDDLAVYAKSYLGVVYARAGQLRATVELLAQALTIAEVFPDRRPFAAWRWALAEAAAADPELFARSLGFPIDRTSSLVDPKRIAALRSTAVRTLGSGRAELLFAAGVSASDHQLLAELEASLPKRGR